MSQLKINFRHYLATKPIRLTKKWIRDHPILSSPLKTLILEANLNNNYYYPTTINKEPTFNRFQLLDDLENGYPPVVVVISSRNNAPYVKKNLQSVAFQKYPNFRIIYLDDQSTDDTVELVKYYSQEYGIEDKLKLVIMPERNRQGASRFRAYHMCDDDEIICMLDGDDWLYNMEVLSTVANQYIKGAMVTYGSYLRYNNGKLEKFLYGPDENFNSSIAKTRDFRGHRWITQHLRTGYAGLFKRIRYLDLVDKNNEFLKVATDVCETMPILEMAYPQIAKISSPTYVYNVDASNCHNTSYFRVGEFPEQKMIRQRALTHIKNTKPYSKVTHKQLKTARYLYPTYKHYITLEDVYQDKPNVDFIIIGTINNKKYSLDALVKLLDACQLPVLVLDLQINNPRFVFSKDIAIGPSTKNLNVDFCIISSNLLGLLTNNTVTNTNNLSNPSNPNNNKKIKIEYKGYLVTYLQR